MPAFHYHRTLHPISEEEISHDRYPTYRSHVWPLFLIAVLAAVYALQFILDRLEQIIQRPLEKIEQRLFAIDASLHEANRHRERLIGRIDRFPEHR